MDDEPPLRRGDAASQLSGESLDSYSQEELVARIGQLEAEIIRVKAQRDKAAAHRLAADAFFRSAAPATAGPEAPPSETAGS